MTNSSLSSVLKSVAAAAGSALLLCGCGESAPKTVTVDDLVDETAAKLALGQIPEAQAAISNAYSVASGDVDVRLLKAQVDFHGRDYESAAKLYRGVANDEKLDRKVRSQGWAGLGVLGRYANDRDAARLDLLRAIRMDGKNAAAWYNLGCVYRDGFGYNEAACDCFETFVRLETNDIERVKKVQRVVIRDLREQRTNTILEIPGSRNVNASACSAALLAAEAAVKKGTFKTAKLRYADALKADPTSFKAALGMAKMCLETDATEAGKKAALEYYGQACRLSPSSVSTFIAAGDLAFSLGNTFVLRAIKYYSCAMAADPTNTTAIDGLIRSLRKNKQKTTADAYQLYRDFLSKKFK